MLNCQVVEVDPLNLVNWSLFFFFFPAVWLFFFRWFSFRCPAGGEMVDALIQPCSSDYSRCFLRTREKRTKPVTCAHAFPTTVQPVNAFLLKIERRMSPYLHFNFAIYGIQARQGWGYSSGVEDLER